MNTNMYMHTNTGTVQSAEDWGAEGFDVRTTDDLVEVRATTAHERDDHGDWIAA